MMLLSIAVVFGVMLMFGGMLYGLFRMIDE